MWKYRLLKYAAFGLLGLVVLALVGNWAIYNPGPFATGCVILVLAWVFLSGGSSSAPQPAADPESSRRKMRELRSKAADEINAAFERGEITKQERDDLLEHTFHAPTGRPPGSAGRRP